VSPEPEDEGRLVAVETAGVTLEGNLGIPASAAGIVLFAHGSGSSRHSPRNRMVARHFRDAGLATLLIDLLTAEEEQIDLRTRHLRFDIDLLSRRLSGAVDWISEQADTRSLKIGCFGSSTGAAAALRAAAERPNRVAAVVSRGGRPDLAGDALGRISAPTLLIVGGNDWQVLELNREAQQAMQAVNRLEIVPGATHLFEEPGTLEEVIRLARDWFCVHLAAAHEEASAPMRR
jgi:dienelactone hydrolase